jgi:hypothetical protein
MVRKAASNKGRAAQPPGPAPKAIPFPRLSEKSHIRCHTFLDDQILLLSVRLLLSTFTFLDTETAPQNVLTSAECHSFVDFIDSQPLELTPPKKRGEAVRVNCNRVLSFDSSKRPSLASSQTGSPYLRPSLQIDYGPCYAPIYHRFRILPR